MRKQFAITVKDSLFDPENPDRVGSLKELAETRLYKVWLYLDGDDVPYVRSVTYALHETFPDPFLPVERTMSNPLCKVAIWTWGIFTVKAAVVTKTGERLTLEHRLTYGSEIQQPGVRFTRA